MKAIRTQIDDLNEEYSIETALDTSDKPDMARQEYKDEADINRVLYRYGVGLAPSVRNPKWGTTIDYDMNLQQAMAAVAEAKAAWATLPSNLRAQYPTWQTLLTAIDNGELSIKLDEPAPTPATPTPE